jgi:hypothetical protein
MTICITTVTIQVARPRVWMRCCALSSRLALSVACRTPSATSLLAEAELREVR